VLLVVPVNLRDVTVAGSRQVQRDGRRERWRAHREVRREELIAAVVDAVSARGASIGMDDISAASGIAKPVFYRYFTDKADLYLAVGRSVAEQVVTQITTVIDRETSPRRMLVAGIETWLQIVEDAPEIYRFVVHHSVLGDRAAEDPVLDYSSVVGRHLARVIGDSMRAAGLDAGAAEPWGHGIVGMVRAATDRWLEEPSMPREALAGYLSDLLWPGLSQPYRAAPAAG
jgi:AcrR family transcriptional regulator